MIKNLIFDFGNVVVRFDPNYMSALVSDNEEDAEILAKTVFEAKTFEATDRGLISLEEHINLVLPKVPKHLNEKAIELLTNWYKMLPIYDGMDELISTVKKAGYKIYILSNINSHFRDNAHKVEVLKLFDGTVFSSEIKCIKPEREIYEYLLCKYSLNADECMFIDDRAINAKGAEKAGIKGYLFEGAEKLRNFINSSNEFISKI